MNDVLCGVWHTDTDKVKMVLTEEAKEFYRKHSEECEKDYCGVCKRVRKFRSYIYDRS